MRTSAKSPCSRTTSAKVAKISLRVITSSPEVISSHSSTRGRASKARASAARWSSPRTACWADAGPNPPANQAWPVPSPPPAPPPPRPLPADVRRYGPPAARPAGTRRTRRARPGTRTARPPIAPVSDDADSEATPCRPAGRRPRSPGAVRRDTAPASSYRCRNGPPPPDTPRRPHPTLGHAARPKRPANRPGAVPPTHAPAPQDAETERSQGRTRSTRPPHPTVPVSKDDVAPPTPAPQAPTRPPTRPASPPPRPQAPAPRPGHG